MEIKRENRLVYKPLQLKPRPLYPSVPPLNIYRYSVYIYISLFIYIYTHTVIDEEVLNPALFGFQTRNPEPPAMAESSDSVSIDVETIYLGGKEHIVRTGRGSVSVIIYGDQEKPALVTYPDLALNHMSCFQGLFFCPEAATLLLHNFCIYHISPPGHESSCSWELQQFVLMIQFCLLMI